jgi:hypothetical protein
MKHFDFSENREKGTYKPCRLEEGRLTANIICPDCGTMLCLNPHQVSADGTVNPSVVCDCGFHEYIVLCGFHEYIVLADWQVRESKG